MKTALCTVCTAWEILLSQRRETKIRIHIKQYSCLLDLIHCTQLILEKDFICSAKDITQQHLLTIFIPPYDIGAGFLSSRSLSSLRHPSNFTNLSKCSGFKSCFSTFSSGSASRIFFFSALIFLSRSRPGPSGFEFSIESEVTETANLFI
eukprot:TRINITY_DN1989_c0_g1_i2.p1 TRINITY_DN1989_c0_g1~~TRINITY_DN1989_c0_g1_i2.p1  ORF type:complete len:150 (+),score=9.08 TRINITY_DN1989_c0_g1_i2:255-704(+)